jgi:hypothetical protein
MSPGQESPKVAESPAVANSHRRGTGTWLWIRVALAVALLGASAAGRAWQARRVDQMLRDGRVSPCSLADIPKVLGPWIGDDEKTDSAITRATGSTDSIFRSYQHQTTGQRISLIVLFGPSTEMYVHSPENCYPAAGYEKLSGPFPRSVGAGDVKWPFYETVFSKGEGGKVEQQEVYCTWRYAETWTPGLTTQKGFERIPGMFKVQIARQIKDHEIDLLDVGSGDPCKAFLAQLMPDLDRRIIEGRAKSSPQSAPAKSSTKH